jgi:hypothetical protein
MAKQNSDATDFNFGANKVGYKGQTPAQFAKKKSKAKGKSSGGNAWQNYVGRGRRR